MGRNDNHLRIGFGFDVHRLVKERPLILGGVEIPFPKGLLGHSDGDVLVHAVIDAILGAVGAGDIGQHFPDTDPNLKGISSLKLLAKVQNMLENQKFIITNLDATVVAEAPKLAPYFLEMKEKITTVLRIPLEHVNLKAKTTEGLGYTGRGEGMAAYAVVLVEGRKH
jgi:2-C-methyl-D-erythritol 2,4-cyclodiphosphate synthase